MEDILKQAEQILNQHKPEFVMLSDDEWDTAEPGTRQLIISIDRLIKTLEDAYDLAVDNEDWHRALLLYQQLAYKPEPLMESETEEFIAECGEWIEEVEELTLHNI